MCDGSAAPIELRPKSVAVFHAVIRFWKLLRNVDTVLPVFRSRFQGKSSPVHFFWGSFDLAVTRFSGKTAPPRTNADKITQEAYSQEVISAGFWPGNGGFGTPAFYCYAAPEPPGLKTKRIQPAEAFYGPELNEFLLRYDDVRQPQAPEESLLAFCRAPATLVRNWRIGILDC